MIRELEEISMNAWPGIQTFLLDGWVLRFANGVTRRANSVIPINCGSLDTVKKVEFCENIYRKNNLPVTFKMTKASCPENLEEILEEKKYKIEAETSVQLLDISGKNFDNLRQVIFDNKVNEQWLLDFMKLSGKNLDNYETYFRILNNIVSEKCLLSVLTKGKAIGLGLGVKQGKYMGIFDVIVNSKYRGKGYGRLIVESIMRWGKSVGAETAYLQVMTDNIAGLNLYSSLGFKEEYKYWYRIKE